MDRVPHPGSERQEPPGYRIGTPSPSERLLVSVVLRPRSSKGERFPQRPANQRLSHEQLEAVHGADPQDIARIEDFAMANNLSVDGVYPARRTVDLSGTTEALMRAFQVDLALYESEGKTFVGHAGHIHVPTELVPLIQGIFGLDNRPIVRASAPGTPSQLIDHRLSVVMKGYNFPVGADGGNETIAILSFGDGYIESDLGTFFANLGVPVPVHKDVSIDGAVNSGTAVGEIGQDIQIAGGVAPAAKLVIYFMPATSTGLLHALQTAVGDVINTPSVIGMSFGITESLFSPFSQSDERTIDQVFQDAAARSITVLSATGDQGSTDNFFFGGPHVEFPASSPNVTACGGSVVIFTGGKIASEVVWNEDPKTKATGGGISNTFLRPSYQSGAGVPLSADGVAGRGIPDVAGHAAGIFTFKNSVLGPFAGTSAVVPLWAGLIALINQIKGHRIGFLNEILYGRLGPLGALNDITVGDNGDFTAGPGWDACTGWGSPNGGSIAALIGPPTISFVSPAAGPVGGGIFVTIRGNRFLGVSLISFGGTDTQDFSVDKDTQITVNLPQNTAAGTVTVTVTTASGTGGGSPNSDFSYVFPVPVILSVSPPSGSVAGGDPISIQGIGFTGVTAVRFNNAGASVTPNPTDTLIQVTTPLSLGAGQVDVQVTTPGGLSAPGKFTYQFLAPVVQSLSQSSGPVAGGTPITITGRNFIGTVAVDFGGAPQPQPFVFIDDSHIAIISPGASNTGTVDVVVTTLGGSSTLSSDDQFDYQ